MHHERGNPQDAARPAILKRADEIADVLKAQAPADEANGTLTPETVAAFEKAGMFGMKLPAVLGGDEADPVTQTLVLEVLSNANASAGWCAMVGATGAALPGDVALARQLLGVTAPVQQPGEEVPECTDEASVLAQPCPSCGGRMVIIEVFAPGSEPKHRPAPEAIDSS